MLSMSSNFVTFDVLLSSTGSSLLDLGLYLVQRMKSCVCVQVFSLTHELRWYQSMENQMRHSNKGYGGSFEGQQTGHGPPRRYGGIPVKMGDAGGRSDGKRVMRGNRT